MQIIDHDVNRPDSSPESAKSLQVACDSNGIRTNLPHHLTLPIDGLQSEVIEQGGVKYAFG